MLTATSSKSPQKEVVKWRQALIPDRIQGDLRKARRFVDNRLILKDKVGYFTWK